MKPLSFIIITYNRLADMLDLARNISMLDNAQELLEEVIIVNNASTENYSSLVDFISQHPQIPFKYFEAPANLGVAKGRNYAIKKGSAPILIMLDDDAILQNKDCLNNILSEFKKHETGRPRAIISFKVLYHQTGRMQVNAFPHKKYQRYKDRNEFETYYYAGGAHAVKRDLIESLGYYPDDFFYGMEEYDLAYRILDKGYSIGYSDRIIMLHKESPLGRKPKKEKIKMMWLNKSKVAFRYLPQKYFYSTALMWSLQYIRLSGFDLKGFINGWKEVSAIPKKEKKSSISKETLEYLRTLDARLWY